MQTQYFVACAAIFNEKGQILLTKRYNPSNSEVHDKWQLPGGSVDQGEHPLESAIREVLEETGLKVKVTSDRPYIFSHIFQNNVHIVLLVYKTHYVSGVLDISEDLEETSDARWFDPKDIAHLESLPETNKIIQAVLDGNH